LTELPELPSHNGLVCQGWNYTLDGIKEYGDRLDVGAMYITDDGKTRLYISIVSDGRMTVPICFGQTVANGVTVDWGDGSTETFDGTGTVYPTHEYSAVGDYVISLAPQDGCTMTLGGGATSKPIVGGTSGTYLQAYASMLRKAEIGSGAVFGKYAFTNCFSMTSVTIPSYITDIANGAFRECSSLTSVTIPSSVTTIGEYAFSGCYSLTSIAFSPSVATVGMYLCNACYSLTSVAIPSSIKTLSNYMFQYCYGLTSVVIPSSVTWIGNYVFYYCYSLASVNLPPYCPVVGGTMFRCCYSLTSVTIPSSVTTIGSDAFRDCKGLTMVDFAEGVKIHSSIPYSAFENCTSLASFSMPIMSSISSESFYSCSSMAYLDFTKYTSVPTLSKSSIITGINGSCKIRVPAALYDEWIVATNWSDVADRIVAV
jgi:hypothetical protein